MDVFGQFLDQRRAAPDGRPAIRPPAKDEAPDDMVRAMLAEVGRRFYPGNQSKRWHQDERALLATITWPAGWLKARGVSLPVSRYRAILVEILDGITAHGDLGKIAYFPAYFERCVRLWFAHNGEALYYRQKGIRDALDLKLIQGTAAPAPQADPMDAIAAAHRVLTAARKPAKERHAGPEQLGLF